MPGDANSELFHSRGLVNMGFYSKSDVRAGDLVYGLCDERAEYFNTGKPFQSLLSENGKFVDDFRVLFDEADDTSEYYKELVDVTLTSFLRHHGKYKTALGNVDNENSRIRRKCKGGIAWAVSNSRTIHFVLDGLEMQEVCEKSYIGNGYDETNGALPKKRSITGAELRWVYRNSHGENEARRNDIVKSVQFWKDFKRCKPPWEDAEFRHYFSAYKPLLPVGSKKSGCSIM
ncbi:hypothetical protein [Chitinimonas arctica]|nr:hypothetical protein [Chitinimonas arctica]